jgi:N-acetylmuramoyl-L-alanine amidase
MPTTCALPSCGDGTVDAGEECDDGNIVEHLLVKDPDRLVLDLEGVEFNQVLQSLPAKIIEADPYIKLIRAGRNKPGVVRVVIELKGEIKPQVFALKPVGEYGHRLVLDLYPAEPVDPLMALLEKSDSAGPQGRVEAGRGGQPRREDARRSGEVRPRPEIARLVTIVLDPGHGGEDPGAIGRGGSYEKHVTLSVARRLKQKIDATPNMRSVLTRDGDYFIPLQQRVGKARRVRADLFVSVHADAFIKPTARGSSVFVLSETGHRVRRRAGWRTRKTRPTWSAASISASRTLISRAPCSTCRRPRPSTTA